MINDQTWSLGSTMLKWTLLFLDIKHEGFEAVCLNKYVLWASLVSINDIEGAWLPPEDNVPSRLVRFQKL